MRDKLGPVYLAGKFEENFVPGIPENGQCKQYVDTGIKLYLLCSSEIYISTHWWNKNICKTIQAHCHCGMKWHFIIQSFTVISRLYLIIVPLPDFLIIGFSFLIRFTFPKGKLPFAANHCFSLKHLPKISD